MDSTDPEIKFDKNGFCNHCTNALKRLQKINYMKKDSNNLKKLIKKIKQNSTKKKYDCIIGVSGGVDSTYTAYLVKKLGLHPLAIHLDNGWDSELSIKNIENICKKLNIDLYTYVIDWEEFKDLQLAFLKASTPDSEIPTDHAIVTILYKQAIKNKIKYIIGGTNVETESILPSSWSQGHMDWIYIKNIQKKFGKKELKTFPHLGYINFKIIINNIYKIKWVSILDYVDYNKEYAKKIIRKELNWKDYGGKHYESMYTKIYQSYILPTKFGYDKRKAHLSSLICSGQITKKEALEELKRPLYDQKELENDIEYLISKFNISKREFNKIMKLPIKSYHDYPNLENSYYLNILSKIYQKLDLKKILN